MGFTPVYPPAHDSNYYKGSAATGSGTGKKPWYSGNPASPLTGAFTNAAWLMNSVSYLAKFIVYLGVGNAQAVSKIVMDNFHSAGASTELGVKDVKLFGSNDPNCVYATYTDETNLDLLCTFTLNQHVASDIVDPQPFTFSNSTAYLYYVFKIITVYPTLPSAYGWRHVELLKDDTPAPVTGSISGTFTAPSGEIYGSIPGPVSGTMAGDFPSLSGELSGWQAPIGDLVGALPALTGAMAGNPGYLPIEVDWSTLWPDISDGVEGYAATNVRARGDGGSPETLSWYSCDPARSVVGDNAYNGWTCWNVNPGVAKFSINFGVPVFASRIHIENRHNSGTQTTFGVNTVSVFGTNNQTAGELVENYADETNLRLLGTFTVPDHVPSDVPDPQYFDINPSEAYQYYVFKCANPGQTVLGWRRLELQVQTAYMYGGDLSGTWPSWNEHADGTFNSVFPSLTGELLGSATMSGEFPGLTGSMTGSCPRFGVIKGRFPALGGVFDCGGTLQATLPAFTGGGYGNIQIPGTLACILPLFAGEAVGTVPIHGGLVSSFAPLLRGKILGTTGNTGKIAWALPALRGEVVGLLDVGGSIALTLPSFNGKAAGGRSVPSELVMTLALPYGSMRGTVPRRETALRHVRNQVN